MIERAVSAGIPFSWVTADEAYGDNGPLRTFLEDQETSPTCWRSARDHLVEGPTAGPPPGGSDPGPRPPGTWHRVSGPNGAKGRRWYDWALFATTRPQICLLVRRSVARPSELAFYLCHTPQPAARRPGQGRGDPLVRWKGASRRRRTRPALDHYQVRLYKAWYRYVTLAMLALAWLAVTRRKPAPDSQQEQQTAG